MSGTTKKQRPEAPPMRGEAAWKAQKEAIARRNERACREARERRQQRDDEHAAELRVAEREERAALARRMS